jgi:tetratricopeptide (TPR) repeat protein
VALLNNEGLEFLNGKEFGEALAKFLEAEKICREIGDQDKLQTCIGNKALWASNTGDPQSALELITEKENICRALNLFSSLVNALAIKATILDSLNKTNDAIKVAEEANQVCVQHGLEEIDQKIKLLLHQLHSKSQLLERLRSKSDTHCSKCGRSMSITTGMMVPRDLAAQFQGCFQCGNCGRYTCYDCSDSREPCECGAKHWIEKSYL